MIGRWGGGLAAACVLAAVAFLGGCGSSSTASSATAGSGSSASASGSSNSAVCKSVEGLKASIAGLKDVNITANGTSAVSAQVTKIRQSLDALKSDAHGQFSTQVTGLSNAMNQLGASLDAAKSSLNAGTLSALATAAGSVVTAGTSLVTAASNAC